MRRVLIALSIALSISGCASKHYPDPDSIVLQDPLPGKAIVYLVRAPYDSARFQVYANERLVAKLPKETYTAVSLDPGAYSLRTTRYDSSENAAPEVRLELQADTRYFLLIAGSDATAGSKTNLYVTASPNPMAFFIPAPYGVTRGTHTWRANSEAEARPMISIATLVLPER